MPRLPYLAVTGVFALLPLLPTSNTDKDIEILVPVPEIRAGPVVGHRQMNLSFTP